MGRGNALTAEELGPVDALRSKNLSQKAIAEKIRRSKTAMTNYRNRKAVSFKSEKPGRLLGLTAQSVQALADIAHAQKSRLPKLLRR